MTAIQFSNEYQLSRFVNKSYLRLETREYARFVWTFHAVKEQSFKNYLTTKVVKVLFSSRKTHSQSGAGDFNIYISDLIHETILSLFTINKLLTVPN